MDVDKTMCCTSFGQKFGSGKECLFFSANDIDWRGTSKASLCSDNHCRIDVIHVWLISTGERDIFGPYVSNYRRLLTQDKVGNTSKTRFRKPFRYVNIRE